MILHYCCLHKFQAWTNSVSHLCPSYLPLMDNHPHQMHHALHLLLLPLRGNSIPPGGRYQGLCMVVDEPIQLTSILFSFFFPCFLLYFFLDSRLCIVCTLACVMLYLFFPSYLATILSLCTIISLCTCSLSYLFLSFLFSPHFHSCCRPTSISYL
ncbi:hypothetical protein BJ165DRAFT_1492898 [Panaeolus papilionaceus]|nr:hypothetical protein BJ165DRAFT_1492898 [Panaeolus papilionaceus]